ncbi:hypothetical protein L914_01313 [Phytophthora nicotianae]|uniref:Uncharacterized protein n=1 Tax=Phytophthora nicotianae TaxID=4792 RepID=W2I5U8_PHYNI|nr:hypothetical protein L916_17952 [Phytophthora nicotianae]ETM55462.1 hypothetical protein L914_01313 [Phytophthora nicotianae]
MFDSSDEEEKGAINDPQEITNDLHQQQELFQAARQNPGGSEATPVGQGASINREVIGLLPLAEWRRRSHALLRVLGLCGCGFSSLSTLKALGDREVLRRFAFLVASSIRRGLRRFGRAFRALRRL